MQCQENTFCPVIAMYLVSPCYVQGTLWFRTIDDVKKACDQREPICLCDMLKQSIKNFIFF